MEAKDITQTERSRFLINLQDIEPGDIANVGTKASHLAALLQASFPVPAGIVLTTDAARSVVNWWGRDPDELRAFLVAAELPAELSGVLTYVATSFMGVTLAVRSSAVDEDLPGASFAGQYKTVLNVSGSLAITQAVRDCWASGLERHVSAYRAHRGAEAELPAILFQRMIEAEAAGVAFSANPVNGRRDEVVIDAVPGTAESLVAGQLTPDHWVVRGQDCRCATSHHGAISTAQALAIAALTRRVAAHFDYPQDIEWAIESGKLYLLQARPITGLPAPPIEPIALEVEVPPGFWQHDASHHPRPAHPIDRFLLPIIRSKSMQWAHEFGYLFDGLELREIGLWLYQRLVPLGGKSEAMPPSWLMWLLVRSIPELRRRSQLATKAVRTDKAGCFVERWYDEWHPELSRDISRYQRLELESMTEEELNRHLDSLSDLVERGIEIHMLLTGALSIILYELACASKEWLGWEMHQVMDLVSGTSFKSTEPARQLHRLALMAADQRALLDQPGGDVDVRARLYAMDETFGRAFDDYLHTYGSRALGYTLAEPTLAELPRLILTMIRAQLDRGYDPEKQDLASARTRTEALSQTRSALADRPTDRTRFECLVERATRAYPVREDNEFFTMSAPFALLRYAVLELGRRLVSSGTIDAASDVMFLDLHEARAALVTGVDHRKLIERRKGERAWALLNPGPRSYGVPAPPPANFDFLPRDARLPMESLLWNFESMMATSTDAGEHAAPDALLAGIGASPGCFTGTVRVVRDEREFGKLKPGDVLVCPVTSPVWSLLFPSIGALVTDTGGMLSHPAIIAREYRIPAVVATGRATGVLTDGQPVTVNGSTGLVHSTT